MSKITVALPDDLAAQLRERAEADDLTVAQLVRRALRLHLQPPQPLRLPPEVARTWPHGTRIYSGTAGNPELAVVGSVAS